ncbi:hypothetical protein MKW98_009845 [Papaver atlanticum]|uniref:Uncharacterized protein n=1 Tax=Papaver atlanticum TaxID=357466 RepID=A0AAD4SWI7_9MAGN|nr:hypothetical protein MKW98_009845 [Papaver atlanticum]
MSFCPFPDEFREETFQNDKPSRLRCFSCIFTGLWECFPQIQDTTKEEAKLKLSLNSTSLKSAQQIKINVRGKYCQNKEDAGAVIECQSGGCGFYIGDQWHHHPQCWTNKSRDRFLEMLLMVSSFLLSFATSGALYFTQALTIVGSHDDRVLKHSLAGFKWVFAASFFINFLGVFALLILQSRREYHKYKKYSLTISNIASFLFMVLGYGLVIAFNIQRR